MLLPIGITANLMQHKQGWFFKRLNCQDRFCAGLVYPAAILASASPNLWISSTVL